MSFQQWDPTAEPIRPGLYINFTKAAAAQITGGAQGTVAIPLEKYNSEATPGKFYTIENEQEAVELFGLDNAQSVILALLGGAKDVLVYTLPESDSGGGDDDGGGGGEEEDDQPETYASSDVYAEARNAFEARPFNVFVYDGEVSEEVQISTVAWVEKNREEKKHFTYITGGSASDDKDSGIGDARSTLLSDDYVVNLISGAILGDKEYSSGEYASYIAGLVAGTPINKAITYSQVRADDVTKRLRNSEIETSLEAGSLILVHDGEKVIVEQGITSSGEKLRKVRARQAISTDIEKTARNNYIGKLDNNEAGQMTLISAISSYLETLENENVLTDINVQLSPTKESIGDKVYIDIDYVEVDSMERVFLTINV